VDRGSINKDQIKLHSHLNVNTDRATRSLAVWTCRNRSCNSSSSSNNSNIPSTECSK